MRTIIKVYRYAYFHWTHIWWYQQSYSDGWHIEQKAAMISWVIRPLVNLITCFGQIILNSHTQMGVHLQGHQVLKLYTYSNDLTLLR